MWEGPTINDMYDETGVKYYSLGFVNVNKTTGLLQFGDHDEADYYKDQIDKIREKGGDVIISFGGAFGETTEPAVVITDTDKLVRIQFGHRHIWRGLHRFRHRRRVSPEQGGK